MMNGKGPPPKAKTPPGDTFVKLTRDLLECPDLPALSGNALRFLLFLMREHLRQRSQHNGRLKAPHRQLVEFGIHAEYVAPAIREVEQIGLVDCHRGGMRVATTYTLNWAPFPDGTMPARRWKIATPSRPEVQKSATENRGSTATENRGRCPESATERRGR